jgi:biopolymer transport protein ExbD
MIVPLPRSRRTSEDNVLPLINIVFLLLIFFMIAGALSTRPPFELQPPRAEAAPSTPAPATAGIAIADDGRIAFRGEEIALDALVEKVRQWDENRDDDKALTLRSDGGADSERLLAVMTALRDAGIERIRMLAVGGQDGAD